MLIVILSGWWWSDLGWNLSILVFALLMMNKECLICSFCFSLHFWFAVVTLQKIDSDWLLKNRLCFPSLILTGATFCSISGTFKVSAADIFTETSWSWFLLLLCWYAAICIAWKVFFLSSDSSRISILSTVKWIKCIRNEVSWYDNTTCRIHWLQRILLPGLYWFSVVACN